MASLEQRIADTLADGDATSAAIVALITEAESAAQEAEAAAAKARADALNPTVVVDVAKVGAELASVELRRDRMRAALPKLREQLEVSRSREYEAAWLEDFKRVEGEVDALAAELTEAYTQTVARLTDILERIPALDAQVADVNSRAPPGVRDRLLGVERTARHVDGFGINGLAELRTELKLPKFKSDGDRYQFAWPPPQPSLAAQMARAGGLAVSGVWGPDWHEKIKERDRQIVAEIERAAAESEAREREREKREKAEIEALKERDRQAHRERSWP
jgi:hypothetical protein